MDALERARRALTELRKLAHAVGEQFGIHRDDPFPLSAVELFVDLDTHRTRPDRDDEGDAELLLRQMRGRLATALEALVAYHPGRVYCFQCESASCSHAQNDDPRVVFDGYKPTGKPVWTTFTNACLARGEARVDQLFGDQPRVLAIHQNADDLQGALLEGFGRDSVTYNVLGQVSAGLLDPSILTARGGRTTGDRFAFSVQIVETRSDAEPWRLRLNIIGLDTDALVQAAADFGDRSPAGGLLRTLRATNERVDGISRRIRASRKRGDFIYPDQPVNNSLAQLKGDLERIFRAPRRRTAHGQLRHQGGERPTGSALKDAQSASLEHLFYDSRKDTVVVLGPRGRVHIYTQRGKHVTSLQLERPEVERRIDSRRWRRLEREDAEAFQQALE